MRFSSVLGVLYVYAIIVTRRIVLAWFCLLFSCIVVLFMLYLLSTSRVLTLAYSTLFPLGDTLLLLSSCRREGVHPELPGVRGLLGVSSPSRRPCGAQLLSFVLVLYASAVSDIFVINVINNIRTRFIISFT